MTIKINKDFLPADTGGSTSESLRTTLTTSASQIETPDGATKFKLVHRTAGIKIWIGEDAQITEANAFPVEAGEIIDFDMELNNNNDIFAFTDSGTVQVYVTGVF